MTSPSMRLVVPHFSPRPAYFPLVVQSMAANPDVSWLLLTEQPVPDAPPNVAVQLCKFEDLAQRIRSHFEFEISLERPYKLCDFRPAFSEIFADELTGYDFWGHSDLDLPALLESMLPAITSTRQGLGQALLRGRYTAAVARMEHVGVYQNCGRPEQETDHPDERPRPSRGGTPSEMRWARCGSFQRGAILTGKESTEPGATPKIRSRLQTRRAARSRSRRSGSS
jgi:hypothetical protein